MLTMISGKIHAKCPVWQAIFALGNFELAVCAAQNCSAGAWQLLWDHFIGNGKGTTQDYITHTLTPTDCQWSHCKRGLQLPPPSMHGFTLIGKSSMQVEQYATRMRSTPIPAPKLWPETTACCFYLNLYCIPPDSPMKRTCFPKGAFYKLITASYNASKKL